MEMEKLLIQACRNRQKGIVVSFLKKNGIDINYCDNDGYTALCHACMVGSRDIIKILIENGADVCFTSNNGETPLHLAANYGNKEILRMLLDNGADIDATDNRGKSSIIYAVKAGKGDAAKFLKESGADINLTDDSGITAIDYANIGGRASIIKNVFQDAEIHTDTYGNTPLHLACYNAQSEAVRVLLQNPEIDINAVNDLGVTALHVAVENSNIYITELLLKAGADSEERDNNGDTFLHMAARQKKTQLVHVLLKHGTDVNSANKFGETPLICACKAREYQKPNSDIVALLLEYNAKIDAVDAVGHSAIYYATEGGNPKIVEMLLGAGAAEERKDEKICFL